MVARSPKHSTLIPLPVLEILAALLKLSDRWPWLSPERNDALDIGDRLNGLIFPIVIPAQSNLYGRRSEITSRPMLFAERGELAALERGVVFALTIQPLSEMRPLNIGLETIGKTGASLGEMDRLTPAIGHDRNQSARFV